MIKKFCVPPTQIMYLFYVVSRQTVNISTHNINLLVFVTEREGFYCAALKLEI
jgi:hypothetical protein